MSNITNIEDSRMAKFNKELEEAGKEMEREAAEWQETLTKYENHPELKDLIQEYREHMDYVNGRANQEQMVIDNTKRTDDTVTQADIESVRWIFVEARKSADYEAKIKSIIEKIEKRQNPKIIKFA